LLRQTAKMPRCPVGRRFDAEQVRDELDVHPDAVDDQEVAEVAEDGDLRPGRERGGGPTSPRWPGSRGALLPVLPFAPF
jgi:hypothetical protein